MAACETGSTGGKIARGPSVRTSRRLGRCRFSCSGRKASKGCSGRRPLGVLRPLPFLFGSVLSLGVLRAPSPGCLGSHQRNLGVLGSSQERAPAIRLPKEGRALKGQPHKLPFSVLSTVLLGLLSFAFHGLSFAIPLPKEERPPKGQPHKRPFSLLSTILLGLLPVHKQGLAVNRPLGPSFFAGSPQKSRGSNPPW